MWPVINKVLWLVEITAFRLESKSCKIFFVKNKFSNNESTRSYNRAYCFDIYIYCDIRRLANIDNATFTMHQSYPEQLLGRIAKKAFGQLGCKGG